MPSASVNAATTVKPGARRSCLIASGLRVHAALDELARAHLDVQRELLVDFLFDRNAP
jgi:hypothetical protein